MSLLSEYGGHLHTTDTLLCEFLWPRARWGRILNIYTKKINSWINKCGKGRWTILPGIESRGLSIVLDGAFLHDEAHALEEGGSDGGRLFPQQDVNGVDRGETQRRALTLVRRTALRVCAVHQAVCSYKILQKITIHTKMHLKTTQR